MVEGAVPATLMLDNFAAYVSRTFHVSLMAEMSDQDVTIGLEDQVW